MLRRSQRIYDGKLKGKPGSIQKALAHRPATLGNFLSSIPAWGARSTASFTRPCTAHVPDQWLATTAPSTTLSEPSSAGLTSDKDESPEGGNYSGFSEQEQAGLRLREKLTRTPSGASDTDFGQLKKHFLTSGLWICI